MPLANSKLIKRVKFNNEDDSVDWYDIRLQVGFVEAREAKSGNLTPDMVLEYSPSGDFQEFLRKIPATSLATRRLISRFCVYVVDWSHPEEINRDTIALIPEPHAIALEKEIDAIETMAAPFRRDDDDTGSD